MKSFRNALILLLGFALVSSALAHRFAPSLLKVNEIAPLEYNMVWKTPAQGVSNVPLRPLWPESCEVKNASAPQLEDTGVVTSWQLACPDLGVDGLVGETLGVSGLGANQASAMLINASRMGSFSTFSIASPTKAAIRSAFACGSGMPRARR